MEWLASFTLFCSIMLGSGFEVSRHPADRAAYVDCVGTITYENPLWEGT